MTKFLAAITAASALFLARWVFITTAGFNRELDLIDTIIVGVFLVPLALAISGRLYMRDLDTGIETAIPIDTRIGERVTI